MQIRHTCYLSYSETCARPPVTPDRAFNAYSFQIYTGEIISDILENCQIFQQDKYAGLASVAVRRLFPGGRLGIYTDRDLGSIFWGFELRESVFFRVVK